MSSGRRSVSLERKFCSKVNSERRSDRFSRFTQRTSGHSQTQYEPHSLERKVPRVATEFGDFETCSSTPMHLADYARSAGLIGCCFVYAPEHEDNSPAYPIFPYASVADKENVYARPARRTPGRITRVRAFIAVLNTASHPSLRSRLPSAYQRHIVR